MATLEFDTTGEHYYNTGIDEVVFYPKNPAGQAHVYGDGVAWEGVSAMNENPTGGESNKVYADNVEYLNLMSKEEFGVTAEFYNAPDGFMKCAGAKFYGGSGSNAIRFFSQKKHEPFGLSYRELIGNDETEAGELMTHIGPESGGIDVPAAVYHLVYNCKAGTLNREHPTVNETPEATSTSCEITTTDLSETDRTNDDDAIMCGPTSHIVIDTRRFGNTAGDVSAYNALMNALHGTASANAYLPTLSELDAITA